MSRSRSVVPGKGVVEGPTKNGRSRSMTISYCVVSTLWSLHDFQKRMARENNRKVSPYLFANAQGEPVHPDTFTKRLRKIFRELGFPSSFHLHTLRHYFVSAMLHEGVDNGDTSFLERTYCHPQMKLKQEAPKSWRKPCFGSENQVHRWGLQASWSSPLVQRVESEKAASVPFPPK